jgi:hypothetical protein
MMRRLAISVLFLLVLAVAGWSLAWWLIADRVEAGIGEALADTAESGVAISCADREQGGFPFRFETICTDASAQPPERTWSARLARLEAGAWFYRPRHIEARLHGPFQLSAEDLDQPQTADWDRATAEIVAAADGAQSVSVAFTNPVAQAAGTEVATDSTHIAVAPGEAAGMSRVLVEAAGLRLPSRQAVPAADLSVQALTPLPPEALLSGNVDPRSGIRFSDVELRVESEPVQAFAQGAIDVDAEGLVNGSLEVHLVGVENLPELIEALPEDLRQGGNVLVGALLALAAPAEWRGRPARRIVIHFDKSEVRAGTLPLGRLPPLWRPPVSS